MGFEPKIPIGEQMYFSGKMLLGTVDGNIETQLKTEKDQPGGYAGLDEFGKIEEDDLPDELDGGIL